MNPLPLFAHRMNHWLLLLLAFCLPLSTSAMTVLVLLIMVVWLVEGNYKQKIDEILSCPISVALLVFLAVMVLGVLWSESIGAGLEGIKHRWKILVLPLFLGAVRLQHRWAYLNAFIGGVLLAMVLVDLSYFGVLKQIGLTAHGYRYHRIINHMVVTPMMALAIYLLFHQFLWGMHEGWRKWGILVLGILMVANIFLMRGRSGQIAFILLMATLVIQYYQKNIIRALLIICTVLPLLFMAAYQFSPVFQQRLLQVQQNITTLESGRETSVGLRLHYWLTSWRMIRQSPWLGVGTGDFAEEYEKINQQYSPALSTTDNPHNQYIFVTAQLGVVGLLALLGLFGVYFRETFRINDGWQRIRFAVPLFFMTIMLSESYLDISGTGFLFSLLSAILFKQGGTDPGAVVMDGKRGLDAI